MSPRRWFGNYSLSFLSSSLGLTFAQARPGGGIGIHKGLKIPREQSHARSNRAPGIRPKLNSHSSLWLFVCPAV